MNRIIFLDEFYRTTTTKKLAITSNDDDDDGYGLTYRKKTKQDCRLGDFCELLFCRNINVPVHKLLSHCVA
ncbi:hypothetical protein DERP_009687 [Dermatophagoides pteronyssinus]|uniref:Uncharacterized protein n=1 Tax=Dermatophagoides pteronyssinus TaxID=6956 RepID=A0ABQ8JAN9_DERPT|nr:hypothetical protein DERP_009687 [Dermatophagoides pteronyssinus]